jgi:hypothetical protein
MRLGLDNEYVDITPMDFTQDEANVIYDPPMSRIEYIDVLREQIIDGEITVAQSYEDISGLIEVRPELESPTLQIPHSFYSIFVGLFTIIVLKKSYK